VDLLASVEICTCNFLLLIFVLDDKNVVGVKCYFSYILSENVYIFTAGIRLRCSSALPKSRRNIWQIATMMNGDITSAAH